jgi:hypothetical protein
VEGLALRRRAPPADAGWAGDTAIFFRKAAVEVTSRNGGLVVPAAILVLVREDLPVQRHAAHTGTGLVA